LLIGSYRSPWYRGALSAVRLNRAGINIVTILLMFIIYGAYRAVRPRLAHRRTRRKRDGRTIGIDLDGVLGDQVTPVLPRILQRYGVSLQFDDVTEWRLPVDNSDIAHEIARALTDPDYIREMPVHHGAEAMMARLYRENTVVIVTARADATSDLTRRWLFSNRLWHDELVHTSEAMKSEFEMDVLLDDYVGNVAEYLENAPGKAVLLRRPWNRDTSSVRQQIAGGRLFEVSSLDEVAPLIQQIAAAVRAERNHPDLDGEVMEDDTRD
jgi:5'(3')-deoxyribonucleotidase